MSGDIIHKVQRRLSGIYNAKPYALLPNKAVISFTFDDVPQSAVTVGAKILETHGVAGTFYLSGSLAGTENLGLPQYTAEDIKTLLDGGHEIGCHTYSHMNVQNANATEIEMDLDRNLAYLQPHIGDHALTGFSYPFGCTSIPAKNIMRRRFSAARGIKAGVNAGMTDLSQLKANAIYDHSMTKEMITDLIKSAQEQNGWLVFYTHDLSDAPTAFGCSPNLLEFAVEQTIASGCDILTMRSALARKAFKAPESHLLPS